MNLKIKNPNGAKNMFYRFALLICAFLLLFAVSFAQTKSKNKKPANANLPKVTKIDEVSIKKILVPDGKPLLVNFWATWCVPCREEFPDLVEIDKEYKGKIDFITISLDDLAEIKRDVPKFLSEMKAEMPAYLLNTNEESAVITSISKDWQGGLPFTVLYNEKGEIVHFKQGKIKPEIVKEKINNLLSAKSIVVSVSELPKTEILSSEDGKKDAKNDIAKGILKIKRYGLTAAIPKDSINELKKKYDIEITENGCVLINTTAEYFTAYNEVMKTEISKRFGVKFLKKLPL